ncbi:diguanylate cyclase [Haloplasma contractile]|uniref:Metal dependent phosphohydrolase protein n=1 Tax=Haloplasma contractile SSD-17B TaxID=1033810 RepID=U2DU89_9MOLU|nr:diguanylate cyclase [Haloplasma contractile]ERJ11992.1 Metal dependent phosphohydrolase protein [Haloplasma contractile SSD-17B]
MTYLTIIPFVGFICYTILFSILMGSRKNKLARNFIYYIISMIIWSLGSFLMRTDLPPSHLFWNRILCTGLISFPVLFYQFTLVLTKHRNQKFLLYAGYVLALLFHIANVSGLIIEKVMIGDQGRLIYKLGPLAPIMAVWGLIYLLISFYQIYRKVQKGEIPFVRVKLILHGLILVIIGAMLNFIESIGQYPFDIILNTINAILITYSIYRYKFLEIKLIVKKGITYSLYTLILTGVYIVSIFGVQQFLREVIGYTNMTAMMAVAVILALIFQPIKNLIQHWIDKLFYRENLDHKAILKEFSRDINNILDLDEITDCLKKTVQKGLQPSNVTIALKREGYDYFYIYDSLNQNKWCDELKYGESHPIVEWFYDGNPVLTIGQIENSQHFASLWGKEKKQLSKLELELIVPILYREELMGLFILSENKSGEAYTKAEIDLLSTLVNNAAAVIENAKLYEFAKNQAITDGLTKLHNHRYFHDRLKEIVNKELYDVFSIAMIDVDLFKFYNDFYGHSAGDRALIRIAEVLRDNTYENDIVVRYGGEEFAIIYPNILGEDSYKALEKIRKAVENTFASNKNYSDFITISAGVANYPGDGKTIEDVLDAADRAMYEAKHSGRNKVVLYSYEEDKETNNYINDQSMQDSIKSAYLSSIYALAATIDAKDSYTYGHSENVANLAVELGKAALFNDKQLEIVKNAGLLHDIGKIGIPESILTKPDRLTEEEQKIMRKHVDISITIIKHVPNLIEVIPSIMSHHERYDGKGYPRGMKGESIPIEGRCLCIVDSFDAMITDRPYRKGLTVTQAINELRTNKGKQFDPELTDIFISLVIEGKIDEITILNRTA